MIFVFLFLLGLVFGSFIAAWVSRAHHEMSIWFGRSHCLSCQFALEARDLVPVFSFLFLKGKCRNCETKISKYYFFTELLTGIVFLFLGIFYQVDFFSLSFEFIFALLSTIFLIAVFVSDFLYQEIPFGMTIPPAILLFLFSFWTQTQLWHDMLFGAIIAAGFFLLQYIASKGKWMGFGDVGLGVFLGIILGVQKTLLVLALAYVGGAVVSLILLALKRSTLKTQIPFGVFLSFAAFVTLLWGEKVIDWYLKFL